MENENKENMEKIEEKAVVKTKLKLIPIIIVIVEVFLLVIIAVLILITRANSSELDGIPHGTEKININGQWQSITVKKPVIYIYPTQTTEISVKLGKPENITCSYPKYNNGWQVIANPDGKLIDTKTGRKLYSLYWEGLQNEPVDFNEGFVVEGKDSIEFLEEKLEILGLNEIEAEEFIVYWLPRLQENKYNLIRFASMEEINDNMPLELSEKPDTIIRILMQYKALDEYLEVKEQELIKAERVGFTVVEWGGTEVK